MNTTTERTAQAGLAAATGRMVRALGLRCGCVAAAVELPERAADERDSVRSSAWVGISARTQAQIKMAAAREGMIVTKARWERVRKGGIMCGPEGGWMVVVRGGPRLCEDVALGLTLGELYDDLAECGRKLRYLGNLPGAGIARRRSSR
jgi:hypothetical protein